MDESSLFSDTLSEAEQPDALEEAAIAFNAPPHTLLTPTKVHPSAAPGYGLPIMLAACIGCFIAALWFGYIEYVALILWISHIFSILLFSSSPFILPVRKRHSINPVATDALPVYTVLVPVYDEANMLPQLARALHNIDYPPERLDIMILLEADDQATSMTAARMNWPEGCRLVCIPTGTPRSKPNACNYGLRYAKGDFLVVYDAEDIPHPQQLRAAVATFNAKDKRCACLQAPLEIKRQNRDWLEGQFVLEYRQLFSVILPVMCKLNLPIPLGGTSNHFRVNVLRDVNGWDAWNLTEDADLGLRLAMEGYKTRMLDLPTYENAPHQFFIWFRQRTRWISGHMQTLYTHGYLGRTWISKCGLTATIFAYGILLSRILSGLFCVFGLVYISLVIAQLPASDFSFVDYFSIFDLLPILIYSIMIFINFRLLDDLPLGQKIHTICTTIIYWMLTLPALLYACGRIMKRNFAWLKTPHQPYGTQYYSAGIKFINRMNIWNWLKR